ncbi:MAG: YidC/Oxa1 family membrane protein insertase, partial [Acidimicrobiales bacterium]
ATPFGGCLPMLVQAPVFLVMWRVLVGLLKKTPEGLADPSYLDHSSQLYRALVRDGGEMVWLGFDLAKNASTALDRSVGTAVPYFLLILAVMATTYYQQRQVQARNPNAAKLAAENPQLAMTQRIMKIFPLMYGIFGFTIPAGVMVYLLVSNLFRIFQQALLYKFDPRLSFPEVAADEAAPPPEADAKPAPTKAEAKAPKTTKATTPPKGKPTGKPPAVAPAASAPAKNGANGRRPSQSRSQGRKQPKKRSR